jgi:hypothetical protein
MVKMAVLTPYGMTEDLNYFFKGKSECFYCGAKIPEKEICIYWMGADVTGVILFHKDCAVLFAGHLMSDFNRLIEVSGEIAKKNNAKRGGCNISVRRADAPNGS